MELKEYQAGALEAFCRWHDALASAQEKAETAIAALHNVGVEVPNDLRNYPKTAWEQLAQSGGVAGTGYVSRTDGAGRPIPHICFKVPTGGGKTLLAAATLERLNRQSGLTLWITPTRAIYQQTKSALWNREHPYRQMLERASGGRVKLIEKEDTFTAADVEHYLCVMLLMLPAANRQEGRDFLRMFRDSGRYPTLFPDSDDMLGDARLLNEHPDLERNPDGGSVKHSLFNVFKMLRPVTVLDEAHKAYGPRREANEEFVRSVNHLNPRLVIELSATPNRGISNLLVDITGVELKSEEMIKLPVQVKSYTNSDWQHTLTRIGNIPWPSLTRNLNVSPPRPSRCNTARDATSGRSRWFGWNARVGASGMVSGCMPRMSASIWCKTWASLPIPWRSSRLKWMS